MNIQLKFKKKNIICYKNAKYKKHLIFNELTPKFKETL